MKRFEILTTPLNGLKIIRRIPIKDERGFFTRLYCNEEFKLAAVLHKPIVQINHTLTKKKGAIRGLHFQFPPYSETKVVTCINGEIFDVAVDLRHQSPTFLKYHAEILSKENNKSFIIPEGFAHGYQTLSQECELIYLHTALYQGSAEGALNAKDPTLDIQWPLPISEMSERDKKHSFINHDFIGLKL